MKCPLCGQHELIKLIVGHLMDDHRRIYDCLNHKARSLGYINQDVTGWFRNLSSEDIEIELLVALFQV